ncbi:hypothetical protein N9L68_01280 [bacterium]|nr:hypothetical protein [bacterium]
MGNHFSLASTPAHSGTILSGGRDPSAPAAHAGDPLTLSRGHSTADLREIRETCQPHLRQTETAVLDMAVRGSTQDWGEVKVEAGARAVDSVALPDFVAAGDVPLSDPGDQDTSEGAGCTVAVADGGSDAAVGGTSALPLMSQTMAQDTAAQPSSSDDPRLQALETSKRELAAREIRIQQRELVARERSVQEREALLEALERRLQELETTERRTRARSLQELEATERADEEAAEKTRDANWSPRAAGVQGHGARAQQAATRPRPPRPRTAAVTRLRAPRPRTAAATRRRPGRRRVRRYRSRFIAPKWLKRIWTVPGSATSRQSTDRPRRRRGYPAPARG